MVVKSFLLFRYTIAIHLHTVDITATLHCNPATGEHIAQPQTILTAASELVSVSGNQSAAEYFLTFATN
jgi:hypothetical protein